MHLSKYIQANRTNSHDQTRVYQPEYTPKTLEHQNTAYNKKKRRAQMLRRHKTFHTLSGRTNAVIMAECTTLLTRDHGFQIARTAVNCRRFDGVTTCVRRISSEHRANGGGTHCLG